MLSIAPDAAPGWRDAELRLAGRTRRVPRFFEVLAQGSGGGGHGLRGIGSHLI